MNTAFVSKTAKFRILLHKAYTIVTSKWFLEVFAALLILLFAYTALSKARDFNFFLNQLSLYPIIKNTRYDFIAYGVIGSELVISALLFFPKTRRIGFLASVVLLTIFTVYLKIMVTRYGSELPCSCGGVLRKMTWHQHVYFNLFFILISLLGYLGQRRSKGNN